MRALRSLAGACALAGMVAAGASPPATSPTADTTTPAALADLGLAMLRQGSTTNAVVSPVATAAALGMLHAGLLGPAEAEIEALFGPVAQGPLAFKQRWPALLQQLSAAPSPFVMAGRVWVDGRIASAVPAGYTRRMAQRYRADSAHVDFSQSEAARTQINEWTSQHTAGRVAELLPPGSVAPATRLAITTAVHFKSPWERPFDPALTAARPFHPAGAEPKPVPMLLDERGVMQARVDGALVMLLPFAGETWSLLLAVPAEDSSVAALAQSLSGATLARWQAALQPLKCKLALPKFAISPKSASIKPLLETLGVKTAFTTAADFRPLLGRRARQMQLDDVHQAAGITIDETGGEAVAAAAATVMSKSFGPPLPDCSAQRPFLFAVLHRASGTPLFMGRIGDPTAD
jgi:serpin B